MAEPEKQIGFEQLGLGSVLKQNQLSVPPNQREYAWTDHEVTTLLQDFAKAIADGEEGYFLGTIVTIPRPSGILEVVDGQQRLATIAILLAEIRNYLADREKVIAEAIENEFLTGIDRAKRERVPRLRLNLDDNEYFRARLINEQPPPEITRLSHERIDGAFKECRAQIGRIVAGYDETDHGDILNRWILFIEKLALVVFLRVPNDSNAYKMFETLNDRGLRTSQSDLVKNYLFGRAGDRLPEVQQKWALMRGALESLEEEDLTINFLRHALTVVRGFVREAQIYDVVQDMVKADQAAVSFVSNLEILSTSYVAIHNPEHEKWNQYPDATRRSLEVLNLLNIRPMHPLMLAIASRLPTNEANKAFKTLVASGVRLLIAGTTRSSSVEVPLANAANEIFQGKFQTSAELLEAIRGVVPTDELFQSGFEIATVSSAKLARYYLRSLEMAAKDEGEPWLIPNDDRQAINLEHILPQKPEGNWPDFEEEQVRMYRRRIGNLALLRASANSDLKSASFEEKKAVYAESPYVLTQQVSDVDAWTPTQISERQKVLAECALKAWAL